MFLVEATYELKLKLWQVVNIDAPDYSFLVLDPDASRMAQHGNCRYNGTKVITPAFFLYLALNQNILNVTF